MPSILLKVEKQTDEEFHLVIRLKKHEFILRDQEGQIKKFTHPDHAIRQGCILGFSEANMMLCKK